MTFKLSFEENPNQNERIKIVDVEIIPITEEHIEGFWSAVDSVARERNISLS